MHTNNFKTINFKKLLSNCYFCNDLKHILCRKELALKRLRIHLFFATLGIAAKFNLLAQTPVVIDVSDDVIICGGNSATLQATVSGTQNCNYGVEISNAYTSPLSDDQFYTLPVNLTFPFTFYGNTYNQVLISTNNYLTFDTTNNTAGGYSPWSIPGPIPDPGQTQVLNAIMGPWQDILPPTAPPPPALGIIKYAILGVTPNRIFILDYNTVTMFSCTNMTFTSQIQLYEGSNVIETHITNKPLCTTWNNGQAIHGLHNSNGTIAHVVPGRNGSTQWTANNDGYRFTPNGPNNYTITPIPFSPYPITSGLGVLQWYANGQLLGSGDSITVSPSVTTDYVAMFFDPCTNMTYSDTVTVTVTNTIFQVSTDSVNCFEGVDGSASAVISGNSGPFNVRWTNLGGGTLDNQPGIWSTAEIQNLAAGVYNIIVTDSTGCELQEQFEIFEPNELTASIVPEHNLCFGDRDGTAQAQINGGTTPYEYQWNDPLAQTTSLADSLYAGTYQVNVSDYHDCAVSATVVIEQPFKLELQITTLTDTCERGVGVARVDVTGGTPFYNYFWKPDSIAFQVAAGIDYGQHVAIVTDANNCIDSAAAEVDNIPSPVADFSFKADPQGVLYPEITFGNLSVNANAYRWNFGDDGGTSELLNPVYLFSSAENFMVSLIAYNDFGCSDTIFKRIEFPPLYTIYFPNGFTPNSDGLNDTYSPKALDYEPESYEMIIFNRWGQEVFRTKDFNNHWNGKDRFNNALSPGVYSYIATVAEWTGFQRKYTGSITIAK